MNTNPNTTATSFWLFTWILSWKYELWVINLYCEPDRKWSELSWEVVEGRKRFDLLTLPYHSSLSLKETRAGTQGRNGSRKHRGTLLTGLLLMICSSCFLTAPRNTIPEVAANRQSRKRSTGLSTGHFGGDIFSVEVSFQNDSSLCQVYKKKKKPGHHKNNDLIYIKFDHLFKLKANLYAHEMDMLINFT